LAVHTISNLDGCVIEASLARHSRHRRPPFAHISLDLDGPGPAVAPGVGTAVRGRLTHRARGRTFEATL
jgi:arginase family enzyme